MEETSKSSKGLLSRVSWADPTVLLALVLVVLAAFKVVSPDEAKTIYQDVAPMVAPETSQATAAPVDSE